jgi:hypothetical protein
LITENGEITLFSSLLRAFLILLYATFLLWHRMKRNWLLLPLLGLLAGALCGCSHLNGGERKASEDSADSITNAIQSVKARYAPDSHMAIFTVGATRQGGALVLTGDVDRVETKLDVLKAVERSGVKVTDRVKVLPDPQLGDQVWGISCLSVASAREQPEHKAEMGTQIWMGDIVRVWKPSTNAIFRWYQVQTGDGYVAWLEKGTFVRCTRERVDAWNRGPLLIVTALEDQILEKPRADAQPVSDVVMCDLVKRIGEEGEWFKVELPDQRVGFLPKSATEDYITWKQSRRATPENIERTARMFLGRPYFWGCNSPKGFDCSGFTKTVFFLNGIDLNRNASAQARQGVGVPLDGRLTNLKKGDLLFFGRRPRRGGSGRVTHVGIYLGDKLFIQSSERVRISSLDPDSPMADDYRIDSLLAARRLVPASQ